MTAAAKKGMRLRLESLEPRENPAAIFALGAQVGQAPVVTVFDAVTRQQKFTVTAYDSSFTGGVNVAVGDVNGDGTGDLITGTGVGGGPIVKVFSGVDGSLLQTLVVGDAASRNGVSVASADIDGDGLSDLIIGTTQNNQPFLTVQKFSDGSVIQSLTPFAGVPTLNIAAGDFDGDGTPDIAVGAGAGNSPRVLVFAGKSNAVLFNEFAFEESFTGGVAVSMGDLNADNRADLIAAAGFLGGPRVRAFLGGTGAQLQNFFAYDSALRDGVFAVAFDANNDGTLEIVTGNGINQPIDLKAFNGQTLATVTPPSVSFVPTGSDTKAPTVTVSTTTNGPTSITPLTFSIAFSEIVNGFAQSDVTVVNGTITGFTKTSDTTYTVLVAPTSTDPVSVSVAADVATDAAGNGNAASNTSTVVVDTAGPTAAISSSATSPTNTNPIPFTMTFSEATTGFTLDDLIITNGTATAGSLSPTSTSVYTFTVTPTGQGTVSVFLPAGKATDSTGNANTASNTFNITFDSVAPTATVNSSAPSSTNTSPIPFSVTFSDLVTGFTESDITVQNGSVVTGTLVDAGNGSFNFSVAAAAEGVVVVTIPANSATDSANNGNTASAPVSVNYDTTSPDAPFIEGLTAATDSGTSSVDGITSNTNPTITGTGEGGATVTVAIAGGTGGTAVVSAGGTWTFTPTTALSDGNHAVTATQTDAAGNISAVSNTFTIVIDTTHPTPAISTTASDPTNTTPIPFTVNFGETVLGFVEGDITVTGGSVTAASLQDNGNGSFSFTVTPISNGDVTVSIAAGMADDVAGNASLVSNAATRTFNAGAPDAPVIAGLTAATDTGDSSTDGITSNDTPSITGTGEAGATVNVSVDGTPVGTAIVDGGGAWTFIPPSALAAGTHTVTATQTDIDSNTGPVSNTFTLVIDTIGPTPAITSTAPDPTSTNPMPFAVDFGEVVFGFDEGDISLSNGTVDVGSLQDTGNGTFNFTVTPSGDGDVTVLIAAGVANDVAGNASLESNPIIRTFDTTAPGAPIILGLTTATDTGTSDADGTTSNTTPTISGTGEIGATVNVSIDGNPAGTAVVDAGGNWTFTPAPDVTEGSHAVTATQTDVAGNASLVSNTFTLVIDTTAPTPAVTSTASDPTGTVPIPFAVDFGEVVDGFDAADVNVTNGTLTSGSFMDNGNGTFTFTVDPDAGATVTVSVSVPAGGTTGVTDVAGNASAASNTESRVYENPGS